MNQWGIVGDSHTDVFVNGLGLALAIWTVEAQPKGGFDEVDSGGVWSQLPQYAASSFCPLFDLLMPE